MFARIVELTPKPQMKDEIVKVLRREVLPILKRQQGFMEFLPFEPETKTEKWIAVTLWAEKRDAERWEREGYPKVDGVLKLYLAAPAICNYYNVETSLSQHFAAALTARGTGQEKNPEGAGCCSGFLFRAPGVLGGRLLSPSETLL